MYTKKMFIPGQNKNRIHGSSIPIANLEEYLQEGKTVLDFLDDFPWLKLSDIKSALNNPQFHPFFT